MRFVRMKDCKAGMVVARDIYGEYGVLLLSSGRTLSSRHIYALDQQGYPGLYIIDELSEGLELEEAVVSDKMRQSAVNVVKEMFDKGANVLYVKNQEMYKAVSDVVYDIVDHIFETNPAVLNVPLMKSFDEYTYQHSVDVGILAIMLGKRMKMTRTDVINLGKAAFFHDIGKMFIPKSILNKKGKLTREEFNVMKKHPELGFDFTKEILHQPPVVNRAVLHHHERFDGAGYPNNIAGKAIPLFSQIISVSDVFDAMGSSRVYKKAQLATEGYEYIMASAGRQFDPEVVELFTRTIAPFPAGLTVRLSNGLHAVVVRNNPNFMMRPLVRAFDPDDPGYYEYINLSDDMGALDVTIIGVA